MNNGPQSQQHPFGHGDQWRPMPQHPQGQPWDLPGPGGPGVPPGPQGHPAKKTGGVLAIVAVIVVLVLIVAGGVAWWILRDTPEKAVQRYFKKLQVAGVTNMSEVAADAPKPGSRDEQLARNVAPRDNNYTVLSVVPAGDASAVTYATPWGSTETTVLRTSSRDGALKVENGTAELTITSNGIPVALTYPMYEVTPGITHKVWPGRYEILAGLSDPSLTGGNLESAIPPFTLKPGEKKSLEAKFKLTPLGRQAVQRVIGDQFRKCVGPSAMNTGCPVGLGNRPAGVTGDFYWTPGDYVGMNRATIAEGQPVDNTCGSFPVTLTANYRLPNGLMGTSLPIATTITGCVDARHTTGTSTPVAWR